MFVKKEGIDYFSNFYRAKLYDKSSKQYLITLDDGRFLFVNKSIFRAFKKGKIFDSHTFNLAKEKGLIITPDNINQVVENIKERYQFLKNGTSLHIVIPTTRCTLECPYCFAEPQKITDDPNIYDMDEETAKKTIRYIMNSPCRANTIEFTGGEPTARFDLVKLMVEYAEELNREYKKDLRFSIVTNLSMMNEEIADFLIQHNVGICTSLDGPEEVNDKNRVIAGAKGKKIGTFKSVKYWIERINQKFKEKGINKKVNALMTITRYSFDYYKEILDLYAQLGIYHVDIRAMMYIGNATVDANNPNEYNYEEFKEFYKNCLNYIDELQKQGIPMEDRMSELYKKKIYENKPTYHVDFESPWGAGTGSLTYSPQGDIYACHESIGKEEFKLGSIHQHSWRDLFNTKELSSTVLTSMLESNPLCDRCVYKPYCGTSPIENLFSQKKFHFNPYNTMKHHETIFHCEKNFNEELENIKQSPHKEKLSILNSINNSKKNTQAIQNMMSSLYEHFSNPNINPNKRNILLSHSYENSNQEEILLKDRIIYHCFDLSKQEINEEINFLNNFEFNNKTKSIAKTLLEKNLLTQYYLSVLNYPDGTKRNSLYMYLTQNNKEELIKFLNIPDSLNEEFMQASLVGIDEIEGEIKDYKLYIPSSKNSLQNYSLPIEIENINTQGIYFAKRLTPEFNTTSYKIQIHYNKKDEQYYPSKFSYLYNNNSIQISEFGFEFNEKNQLLKETCYYHITSS